MNAAARLLAELDLWLQANDHPRLAFGPLDDLQIPTTEGLRIIPMLFLQADAEGQHAG